MKGIEFEEGEAYFHEDDDENIDPDRDFAYLVSIYCQSFHLLIN